MVTPNLYHPMCCTESNKSRTRDSPVQYFLSVGTVTSQKEATLYLNDI